MSVLNLPLFSQLANKMTIQEFNSTATEKLNKLSTKELIYEAKKLVNDFSNNTEYVYDVIMNILMDRLPENEFIEFCNNL